MQNTHSVDTAAAPNCSRYTGQMLGCVPANWNTSTPGFFFLKKKKKLHAAPNATHRAFNPPCQSAAAAAAVSWPRQQTVVHSVFSGGFNVDVDMAGHGPAGANGPLLCGGEPRNGL